MSRKVFGFVLALVLILLLAGCGCDHEWLAATCTAPKTCQLCGETEGEPLPHTFGEATCTVAKTCTVCNATEGEPLPHTWAEATCTVAKTCTVCNTTEGEPLPHTWAEATCTVAKTCTVCSTVEGEPAGHAWQEATCTAAKTCSVCQLTEGEPVAHSWQEATTEAPKTCSVCKQTQGSKLKTDSRFTTKATKELHGTWTTTVSMTPEMMGVDGFNKNVDCVMTMTFGKTGELTCKIKLRDEKAFMADMKQYTLDETYASLAQQGVSKAQADQAMLATYGLTVEGYVDAMLKSFDMNALLQALNTEEVYYVADGAIYTAMTWDAKFEKSNYTLKNGVLTVEGLALEAGGAPLQWKKA